MNGTTHSYRNDPTVPDFPDDKPIIVFDGHCVLCSRGAAFVIRQDPRKYFRLLAAQSELGEALYAHFGFKSGDYDSNILIEDGRARVKSDASIAMLSGLGWPWKFANIFRIIPRPIRDWAYGIIARNRIKWFGRQEQCYLPPPDASERFL